MEMTAILMLTMMMVVVDVGSDDSALVHMMLMTQTLMLTVAVIWVLKTSDGHYRACV